MCLVVEQRAYMGAGGYIDRLLAMLEVSRRLAMLLALMICLAMILLIGFLQKACGVAALPRMEACT